MTEETYQQENEPSTLEAKVGSETVPIDVQQFTAIQRQYSGKDSVKLYVLHEIEHKRYKVGRRLYFEDLHQKLGVTKAAYLQALEFLDGANLVVNEVVVNDKVPKDLIDRYQIQ